MSDLPAVFPFFEDIGDKNPPETGAMTVVAPTALGNTVNYGRIAPYIPE